MSPGSAPDTARLTRLTVSNFRSIGEDVFLEFEPLTVLVGINGSGKSNLMDAPRFVAQSLSEGLENAIEDRNGFNSMLRDVGGPRGTMRLRLELEHLDWTADYFIELGAPKRQLDAYSIRQETLEIFNRTDRTRDTLSTNYRGTVTTTLEGLEAPVRDSRNLTLFTVGGDARLEPIVRSLRNIETYALFPDNLRRARGPSQRAYLSKFGENWPSIVRRVMATPAARDLQLALDRVTGDIIDLRTLRLGSGGLLVAEFGHARVDGRTQWFDAARESDGTLRVAGILTALVQDPPMTMIGIEEPEQTVHAGVLPILVEFFREAATKSRVVVTTHSPDLLDLVPAEAIRVVDRIDGTTRVARLDEGQQNLVKKNLSSPGELLRSQGLHPQES